MIDQTKVPMTLIAQRKIKKEEAEKTVRVRRISSKWPVNDKQSRSSTNLVGFTTTHFLDIFVFKFAGVKKWRGFIAM